MIANLSQIYFHKKLLNKLRFDHLYINCKLIFRESVEK